MQPRRVSAGRGFHWLAESADITGKHFRPLAGVALIWLLVSLLGYIPIIGGLAMIILGPLLTAGLIAAFHTLEQGRTPAPTVLFEGFRRPRARGALIGLGFFVLLGLILCLVVVMAILGSQMPLDQIQGLADIQTGQPVTLPEGVVLWPAVVIAVAILLGVVAGVYFAVSLSLLSEAGTWAALRASWRACLANLPAMLVLALTMIGVGLAMVLMLGLVNLILGIALPPRIAYVVAQIPTLILSVIIQVVFAGAQYRAWLDVFGDGADIAEATDDSERLTV